MCVWRLRKPVGKGQVHCGPKVRAIGDGAIRPWGLMMLSRGRAAFWEILARPLGRSLPQSFGLENSVTIPARLLSLTDAKGLVKREKGAQPRDGILRKCMYLLKCIFR